MAIKMFVSHSTKDKEFMNRLELLLLHKFKGKIDPVVSAYHKDLGTDISSKIVGHIEECKWFLVLLTRNSIVNPTVMYEVGYASAAFRFGIISCILPVVERVRSASRKYVPIDTGVFFGKNVESAMYIAEEQKWDDCINDITDYLNNAFEKDSRPDYEKLEDRGNQLSKLGYNWEAAGEYTKAARDLVDKGETEEAIHDYREAVRLYKESEYCWEASQLFSGMAEILEKSFEIHKAADVYREKAELLSKEYGWEAAKSYEEAGKLYKKVGDADSAKSSLIDALGLFRKEGSDQESNNIQKQIDDLS